MVDGRGAHFDAPGQVRVCLALAQVRDHQQGLPSRRELAPAGRVVMRLEKTVDTIARPWVGVSAGISQDVRALMMPCSRVAPIGACPGSGGEI